MGKFLVTFDASGSESDYERIYKWAHETGGYRYFIKKSDGMVGRLPSTTFVVVVAADDESAALDLIAAKINQLLGRVVTHILVDDYKSLVYRSPSIKNPDEWILLALKLKAPASVPVPKSIGRPGVNPVNTSNYRQ